MEAGRDSEGPVRSSPLRGGTARSAEFLVGDSVSRAVVAVSDAGRLGSEAHRPAGCGGREPYGPGRGRRRIRTGLGAGPRGSRVSLHVPVGKGLVSRGFRGFGGPRSASRFSGRSCPGSAPGSAPGVADDRAGLPDARRPELTPRGQEAASVPCSRRGRSEVAGFGVRRRPAGCRASSAPGRRRSRLRCGGWRSALRTAGVDVRRVSSRRSVQRRGGRQQLTEAIPAYRRAGGLAQGSGPAPRLRVFAGGRARRVRELSFDSSPAACIAPPSWSHTTACSKPSRREK